MQSKEEILASVALAKTPEDKVNVLWAIVDNLVDVLDVHLRAPDTVLAEKAVHDAQVWKSPVLSSAQMAMNKSVVCALDDAILADLFALIEREDFRTEAVYLSAQLYFSLRKYGRNALDLETRVSLLKQGIHGYVWGANLYVEPSLKINDARILGSRDGVYGVVTAQVGRIGE